MKKRLFFLVLLLLSTALLSAAAQTAVPDALPDDLGGKTLYGYLVDVRDAYLPARVFQDAVRYTEDDRANARRAAALIVDATTAKMLETDTADPYLLYLRAYARDLLFQAEGNEELRSAALADYQQVIAQGGTYAQADHDRLAALEVMAGPLNWQVPQMLTLGDMAEVLGVPESELFYVDAGYTSADGSCSGVGYALRSAEDAAASAIFVLAEPQGGNARFGVLKTFAFLQAAQAVPELGDEAVLMGLRNVDNDPALYTTLLVRKDELVLQVRLPFAAWRGGDANENLLPYARAIAARLLENLYDAQRTVPSMEEVTAESLPKHTALQTGTSDSPVPDGMPADLGGLTEYGYLANLRNTYLPASVYGDAALPADERNNARRAAALIVASLAQRFERYGQNPYELEIRAACYRFAYLDTGDPAFRLLAINDYKQAMSTGYLLGRSDYQALAAPLLAPMAGLSLNADGENVALLQRWLIQARYLDTAANGTFDEATRDALRRFEADNSLPEDGVADLDCLLLLYARIDDMDAVLPAP